MERAGSPWTDNEDEIELDSGSDAAMAEAIRDVNLGGCFIRTHSPEPPGTLIVLRFTLPGDGREVHVEAIGRVCWIRREDNGPPGMGVQLIELDTVTMDDLASYIVGAPHSAQSAVKAA